jgi:hypothetical protein
MGGALARTGDIRNAYRLVNLTGKDCSEELGVDREIILQWILQK